MSQLRHLTVTQLRRIVSIKEQIEDLTMEVAGITGTTPAAAPKPTVERRGKYLRSAAVRAAMAAAQKARWAKARGGRSEIFASNSKPGIHKMSAAGRARIAAAAKARWAKAKAAGKNRL